MILSRFVAVRLANPKSITISGWIVGYALKDLEPDTSWRAMLGTGCVLPCVMLALVTFVMPESPRWLVRKDRKDEAKLVLAQVYPEGEDLDAVVATIEENIAVETRESGSVTWQQMLRPNPALKRMLVVGIGVAVCQQLVGIDAIQYFLLFIMKESGITSTEDQFRKRYLALLQLPLDIIQLMRKLLARRLLDPAGRSEAQLHLRGRRPVRLEGAAAPHVRLLRGDGHRNAPTRHAHDRPPNPFRWRGASSRRQLYCRSRGSGGGRRRGD